MPKREKPHLEEPTIPAKRPKESQISQLASTPIGLAFLLKKIEESEEDVIEKYLAQSNGEELLGLLETGYERKSNELAVILRFLATVIVRTRTDLNKHFGDIGRRLAEGVLEDAPLAACFRALKPQSSAEAAKASLQILAAVVSTDPVLLGRSLIRSVNFEQPDWVQISRRRNTKDANDVRTCFVNFIASFLVSNNNLLIRELLEAKNSIALLISECFTDKLDNVLLILTLLRTSVCENPTVSKTIKMRIFTRAAMRQLAYLYAYRGEALSTKLALARSDAEIDTHAVELVRQALHNLLLPLTSSPLRGLVFRERSCLEGGKQNEHLLSLLLSPPMDNAFADKLRRDLVVNCLLACPTLMPSYLAHLGASMMPRDSENWYNIMDFIDQLFLLFRNHMVSRASQLLELSQSMTEFVLGVCDICLPPLCIAGPLDAAFQHDAEKVVKQANVIYKTLRNNMILFLTWLYATEDLKPKGTSPSSITDSILNILPERVLVNKWFKRFSKTLQKEHTDVSLLQGQIIQPPEDQAEEEVDEEQKPEESHTVQNPEEVINTLPKKFRLRLLMLLKLIQDPATEVSEKDMDKLATVWSELAPACLTKLLELIATNSVFKSILFEKSSDQDLVSIHLPALKVALINLLLALAEVNPKATAKKIPLINLLAAYGGSLSLSDRLLLQVFYQIHLSGHSAACIWKVTKRNVIWGDRLADYYRFGATLGEAPQQSREANQWAFLNLLDKDRLLRSALAFPVTRRCLSRSLEVEGLSFDSTIYDPCFLLPLFLRLLSPDNAREDQNPVHVDIRGFYSHHCLAFAIGALSSYSRHIRGLAKSVIARFRRLSEAWKPTKVPTVPLALSAMQQFPEHIQLNFMLDTLRNSLSTKASDLGGGARCAFLFGSRADTSFRLSRVHANFFIHSLQMLTKPEHRMYEVLWNTFMAKPAIDLGVVPDFMRIMFSVHKDFRVERQWMVKLCADSLNDTSDYLLLEKSRVYKYCLLLYADPGVDITTQIQILRLLTATTRIPRACHALTRFHAFPLWLFRHALSTTHAPSLSYFLTIISQMVKAFEEAGENSPCLSMLHLLDATFRKVHDESTFKKRRIKDINV